MGLKCDIKSHPVGSNNCRKSIKMIDFKATALWQKDFRQLLSIDVSAARKQLKKCFGRY
jgi:hypothetical protein